jgi:hypothetical protein
MSVASVPPAHHYGPALVSAELDERGAEYVFSNPRNFPYVSKVRNIVYVLLCLVTYLSFMLTQMSTALGLTIRSGALKLHLDYIRDKFGTLAMAIFAVIASPCKGSLRKQNTAPLDTFIFAHLPGLYCWTTPEVARPAFLSEVEEYISKWQAPKAGPFAHQSAPSMFPCVVCNVSFPRGGKLQSSENRHQFYSATMFKMQPVNVKGVLIPIPHRCEFCRHKECLMSLEVCDCTCITITFT